MVKRVFPDTTDYEAKAKTDKTVMEAVEMGLSPDYAEKTYGLEIDRARLGRNTSEEGNSDTNDVGE